MLQWWQPRRGKEKLAGASEWAPANPMGKLKSEPAKQPGKAHVALCWRIRPGKGARVRLPLALLILLPHDGPALPCPCPAALSLTPTHHLASCCVEQPFLAPAGALTSALWRVCNSLCQQKVRSAGARRGQHWATVLPQAYLTETNEELVGKMVLVGNNLFFPTA